MDRLTRGFLASGDNKEIKAKLYKDFEETSFFDFSAVSDLIIETATTISGKMITQSRAKQRTLPDGSYEQIDAENVAISHGGLLRFPSLRFVIHFKSDKSSVSAIFKCDDNLQSAHLLGFINDDFSFAKGILSIYLTENDCFYLACDAVDATKQEVPTDEVWGVFVCAAALIVLNAPYGIDLEPAPVHKGQAREAKRQNRKLNPVTIIKLSKTVKPERIVSSGRGSPKGFHFVRSHSRLVRYPDTYTTVKAHWRGDPALGIHRANYKVVP